jgi:hypothetical protein
MVQRVSPLSMKKVNPEHMEKVQDLPVTIFQKTI